MCIMFQKITNVVNTESIPRLQGSVTVMTAMEIMDIYEIDVVAVLCEEDFAGIFTRNDFSRNIVRQNLNPANTILYEVMGLNLPCVDCNATIKETYEAMLLSQQEYIPVLDGAKLYGIVSMCDLGKSVIKSFEETKAENEIIMNYIHGGESYAISTYTVKPSQH